MEITPVILKNVLYDLQTRRFHCAEKPLYLLKSFDYTFSFSTSQPLTEAYEVNRPTYIMNYLHSCIGHAYNDTTIPLLSILSEYDAEILAKRGFQLFVLKDVFPTTDAQLMEYLERWETYRVDYDIGSYRGPYAHFHKCFSNAPILFEKTFSTHRYIRFSTLIYGGNDQWQRSTHNCADKYPERKLVPVVTDEQIGRWIDLGRAAFADYIGLKRGGRKPLLVARRGARQFTEGSLRKLISILETEPVFLEDYSFEEQIQMFANANCVVSPHGSGLYHLLWCPVGTRIIEIFATDDSRKRIFESFAEFLKLDYTRIECSQEQRTTDEPIHVPDWALNITLNTWNYP